jgi:hypothetical protein
MTSPLLRILKHPVFAVAVQMAVTAALMPGAAFGVAADPELPPCPCNLSGHVVSWDCVMEHINPVYPYRLGGIQLQVGDCLGTVHTTTTDETGYFVFECIRKPTDVCPACIKIVDGGSTQYITSFDASLILRYLVTLEDLEKCPVENGVETVYPQMVAADVNCQNGINAYDAALILKHSAGLITEFDCPDKWVYYPDPSCYTTCRNDLMLYCIRIGDVSGPDNGPGLFAASIPAHVKVGTPSHYEEYVKVPIEVSEAEAVYSADFTLSYDEKSFELVSVENGDFTDGFMTTYNAVDGNLYVAMAGTQGSNGDGRIAVITFRKLRPVIAGALSKISLTRMLLNEDNPAIEEDIGRPEIFRLSLGSVWPNPAVGSTTISFDISADCNVSVGIYNVAGELVRVVFAGRAEAGVNHAVWDGTDASGVPVAKGVYFCRVESGSATATGKIVHIK